MVPSFIQLKSPNDINPNMRVLQTDVSAESRRGVMQQGHRKYG